MSARSRQYRIALILLAVGSLLIIVGFSMTWAWAVVPLAPGVDDATREASYTGATLFPLAAAAGWLCLAGVAGVIATRTWLRAVVAVVLLVAGLAAAAAAVWFAVLPSTAVDSAASTQVGQPVLVPAASTGWWAAALLGGTLVGYAAIWALISGRAWPTLGSRYERRSATVAPASAWDALDKGQDPTDDLV